MSEKQVEVWVKLRDGAQMIADACNEQLEKMGILDFYVKITPLPNAQGASKVDNS